MKRMMLLLGAIVLASQMMGRPAEAKMQRMSDEAMNQVTAGTAISIVPQYIQLDMSLGDLYYGDADGVGQATSAGYISFTDTKIKGTISFEKEASLDMVVDTPTPGTLALRSGRWTIRDMTLKIDALSVDAIRLGNSPGTGNSLGRIGIQNLDLHMTGRVTATAN